MKLKKTNAVLALLTGCVNHPAEEIPAPEPESTGVILPEAQATQQTQRVAYELNYINMSLELPASWDYAHVGAGVSDGEVHVSPADTVGIRFWPKEGGSQETALALYYYPDLFAVCGTGLQTEDLTLDSGLTGTLGVYDNGMLWDFISFHDTPGSYAVMNEGAESWWDEYGPQAMAILHSIRVGEGLLKESEAVTQAQEVCTVSYNAQRAAFDADSGEWEIWFYCRDNTAGGDQTVWIAPDGTIRTEYGE